MTNDATTYDPFASGDPTPEAAGNPIRTDRKKAGSSRFTIEVTDVSDPVDGDYGQYVLVSGVLKFQVDASGGTQDEPQPAPEVGEDVTYLVSWGDGAPKHVQEEIQRAVKRAGGRKGEFVKAGDVLSVKLVELVEKKANGTRYPKGKEFGKHAAVVSRPEPADDPWTAEFPAE